MSDMNICTETAGRWPDKFGDVSPDEHDDFLAHAEDCVYHAAMLHADEEEVLPYFRAARALSGDGRLLTGDERRRVAARKKREAALWRAAAARKERPFVRIALCNAGTEFSSCGNFGNLIKQYATHRLEPEAGIEIWSVIASDGTTVKAQVGFYELEGELQKGEEFFPLANGYMVGLNVEQAEGELLSVKLRCVESEVLVRELAEEVKRSRAAAAAGDASAPAGAEASPGRWPPATRAYAEPTPRRPRFWQSLPPAWQSAMQVALGVVLVAAVCVATGMESAAAEKLQEDREQAAEVARHLKEEVEKQRVLRLLKDRKIQLKMQKDATAALTEEMAEELPALYEELTDYIVRKSQSQAVVLRTSTPTARDCLFRPRPLPPIPAQGSAVSGQVEGTATPGADVTNVIMGGGMI